MGRLLAVLQVAALWACLLGVAHAAAATEAESTLRGTVTSRMQVGGKRTNQQTFGDVDGIADRLAKLEQKLEDGQRAIRHQYNVQELAAEAERKAQEVAAHQRKREAMQNERTKANDEVTDTIQKAHNALVESRRKDLEVLEGKKKKATEDLKALLAQVAKAEARRDATAKEQARLDTDVRELKAEQDTILDKIQEYKAQRTAAHARLRRANAEVDALTAHKADLVESVAALKQERGALRGAAKGLRTTLKDLGAVSLQPPADSKATSDESGCYVALSRVRDRLTDVGGSVGELLKIKSGLEDRIDDLHSMIATLTARAESLDRDRPAGASTGLTDVASAASAGDDADAETGDEDSGLESDLTDLSTTGADEEAAKAVLDDATNVADATAQAQSANYMARTIARSKRAIELANRNGVTGTVTTVQPVEVHVSPAPSPSPSPAPSQAPAQKEAAPSTEDTSSESQPSSAPPSDDAPAPAPAPAPAATEPEDDAQPSESTSQSSSQADAAPAPTDAADAPAEAPEAAPEAAGEAAEEAPKKGFEIDRKVYEDVLEQVAQLCLPLDDPKTATMRVLYELCKQNQEQTTTRAVSELYEMTLGDQGDLLNQMPGPDECYLPELKQGAGGAGDAKILQVTQSKKRLWPLSLWLRPKSTVHGLQFHESSAKAYEEVGRVLRTIINPEPVNQSNAGGCPVLVCPFHGLSPPSDKRIGYLLLNSYGEVVVVTNRLLSLCPPAHPPPPPDGSKPKKPVVPSFKLRNRGSTMKTKPNAFSAQLKAAVLLFAVLAAAAWNPVTPLTQSLLALPAAALRIGLQTSSVAAAAVQVIPFGLGTALAAVVQPAVLIAFATACWWLHALCCPATWASMLASRHHFAVTDWRNGFRVWWRSAGGGIETLILWLVVAALQVSVLCTRVSLPVVVAVPLAVVFSACAAFPKHGPTMAACLLRGGGAVGLLGFVDPDGLLATTAARAKPAKEKVAWDDGVVWHRASVVFDDGGAQRWFSMVWPANEPKDSAFYEQWNTTLRAAADWEAPAHLNHTDYVLTAGDTARNHVVVSKPFVEQAEWETVDRAGSNVGRAWVAWPCSRKRRPPFTVHTSATGGAVFSTKGLIRKATTAFVGHNTVLAVCAAAVVVAVVSSVASQGVVGTVVSLPGTALRLCFLSTVSSIARSRLAAFTGAKSGKGSAVWQSLTLMAGVVAPVFVPRPLAAAGLRVLQSVTPAGAAVAIDAAVGAGWGYRLLHTAAFVAGGGFLTYKTLTTKTQSPLLLLVAWCSGAATLYHAQ